MELRQNTSDINNDNLGLSVFPPMHYIQWV